MERVLIHCPSALRPQKTPPISLSDFAKICRFDRNESPSKVLPDASKSVVWLVATLPTIL
jgi:hypothetical protein